ncbi:GGDEF domain-containing protein [Devosia ginsengisoli]|uniref:GGDEF domain-containing protein n=1 Tax=Devosia ginsengisoli TaxID=400770 RepID=UPI0026E91EB9|nr:GGDEF domain-containing protein [Devosia ginsengisoli]MCR6673903.1 GGDEF domain-containing protein [Devosia ginsengisoli]
MPFAKQLAACWRMGRTGRSDEALAESRRLYGLAEAAEDGLGMAECLTQIAWFCLQLGLADEGIDCAVAAKELWSQHGRTHGHANASAIYSWLLVEMGLVDEGFAEAETAMRLAEMQPDRGMLAFAMNTKAIALMYCRQDHLAGPLLDRCLELVTGLDARSEEALYRTNLAYSQVSMAEAAESRGDMAEGRRLRELAIVTNDRAIAVAEGCGDSWSLRTALCNGAEYHVLTGNIALARTYLARWEAVAGTVGLRERIHYIYTSAELLTHSGQLAEALALSEEAVALAADNANADHKANTIRRLAEVHEALGNFEQALGLYKQFHTAYQRQMGDVTRRRAQLVEMQLQTRKLQARAAVFEEQAGQDALTGLPNRRRFDAAIEELRGSRFCLGILDLDHFKAVNDSYSHLVGDAVLRRAAELLNGLGWGMQAFRLGGEEFALLFADLDIEPAAAVAEAVREAFSRADWSDLGPGLRVTASIGLAVAGRGMEQAELMAIADRRLYRAKAQGRDRLVATDAVEELEPPAQSFG